MKLPLIAALLCATSPAFAETKTLNGCELILAPSGKFYYRADPNCDLGADEGGSGLDPLILSIRFPDAEEPTDPEEPEGPPAEDH
jgi:hypothetical protein